MGPLLSSWKYEAGFLTVFHVGSEYVLGYFKLHEDARKAALAFFAGQRRSAMKESRRTVRHFRR
jgi:hypothetical protein